MAMDLRHDRFNSTAIFTVVLLAVLAIVLNYPYQYLPAETRFWQSNFAFNNLYDSPEVSYIEYAEGGFPFTWASNRADYPATAMQYSWIQFSLNCVFWIAVSAAIYFIVGRFRQYSIRPWSWQITKRAVRTSEGFLAIGCVLAILAYGLVSYLKNLSDVRASRELQNHGMVITYAMLPKPIAKVIPSSIAGLFSRVREVVLWKPTPELLDIALQTESLAVLVLIEGSLTSDRYEVLQKASNLHELSLRYQPLTAVDFEGIGRIKSLRSLDLRGCTGLADWNGDLPLDRLMQLRIVRCDAKLSNLRLDRYKRTLQSAYLSRRRTGGDRISLHGFTVLKRLSLSRVGGGTNHDILEVELRDLPELSSASIDLEQVFDLDVLNAPRLTTLSYAEDRGDGGMRFGESVATTPMMRKVRLQNVPLLREVEADGMHLESLDIQGADSLARLSIGRDGFRSAQSMQAHSGVFAKRLQKLIDDVGSINGPPVVEFHFMPFGGLDLKPLQKNRRLRSLSMIRCGITDDQVPHIAAIENLQSIDLRGCPVSDQQAMKLLQRDVKLESLLVSTRNFKTIEIVNQNKLKNFFATDALNAVDVCIKDAPQLSAELLLGGRLGSLSIENARALTGLSIDGRLPPQCALQGLRSLRFFAVGGPEATDNLCRTVWECADMDHLTIAYGALTRRSLEKVGSLKKLTVLSLPGSEVTDDIVLQHWQDLQFLSHVNLNETKISGTTAQWLCHQKNLQQFAVNHCPIDRRSLASLADVAQLIELEIAGIGLDVPVLDQCLSKSLIDRLNLSDFPLTPEHVELLASPTAKNVRFLAIANCGLGDEQIRKIIDGHPYLAVDIEGNDASEGTLSMLQQEGRLVDRHDRREFLNFLSQGRGAIGAEPLEAVEMIRGRINDYQFASTPKR